MAFVLCAERYMRQAHNLKVAGSNPAPATNHTNAFLIFSYLQKLFWALSERILPRISSSQLWQKCFFFTFSNKIWTQLHSTWTLNGTYRNHRQYSSILCFWRWIWFYYNFLMKTIYFYIFLFFLWTFLISGSVNFLFDLKLI